MSKEYLNPPIIEEVQIEKTLNHLQESGIVIPKPSEVLDYLSRYPDIIGLLISVCELTVQRFDSQTRLSLELYRDPEIEDEYLTFYIRQQKYDENLMKRIEGIRANYEKMLVGMTGWLLVTTDFRAL
ncbi:MAG TPA: hypothetical protein VGA95_09430 [Thermodesulfobacteriota bacterium]|jgi:hypothetical protein